MSKLSISMATTSQKKPLKDIAAGTIVLDEDNAALIVTDNDVGGFGGEKSLVTVVSLGTGTLFNISETQEFRVALTADLKVTY